MFVFPLLPSIKGLACLMSLSRSFPDLCWEAHSRGVHFAAFLPSSFAGGVCTLITHAAVGRGGS